MKFVVNGQDLRRTDRDTIASDAINYPEVSFEFIQYKWQGIAVRVANFQLVETAYNEVTGYDLIGSPYAMNLIKDEASGLWKTHVPMEILDPSVTVNRPIKFIVTVWGGSVNTKLITTNAVLCKVDESYYNSGVTPGEPTEGIWDQLEDSMSAINTRIDGIVADISTEGGDPNGIGSEIADARIDTLGAGWSSLGNAIRGQINGIKGQLGNRITALETEVTDARVDNNSSTWASLGNAIRGQVAALATRIDYNAGNITNLQTEVADARTDAEDLTYNTLGDSIRGQIADVDRRIQSCDTRLNNKIDNAVNYFNGEVNTGRKWVNGEPIYTKSYSGYYRYSAAGATDVADRIIDGTWYYKNTIIDYEVNFMALPNHKGVSQYINTGTNYHGASGNNKPALRIEDPNGGGHSSSLEANLILVPGFPDGALSQPWPLFYTVTVYYVKNTFAVKYEASKFVTKSGSPVVADAGRNLQVVVPGNSTVAIQTKNRVEFTELIQTFILSDMQNVNPDFDMEIGLYDSAGHRLDYMNITVTEAADVWDGVRYAPSVFPTTTYLYLRFTITNNSDQTKPIAIGPALFKNMANSCIGNI